MTVVCMSELGPDDVADVVQQIADVEGAILQHEEVDYRDSHPMVWLQIGIYDTERYGNKGGSDE